MNLIFCIYLMLNRQLSLFWRTAFVSSGFGRFPLSIKIVSSILYYQNLKDNKHYVRAKSSLISDGMMLFLILAPLFSY